MRARSFSFFYFRLRDMCIISFVLFQNFDNEEFITLMGNRKLYFLLFFSALEKAESVMSIDKK